MLECRSRGRRVYDTEQSANITEHYALLAHGVYGQIEGVSAASVWEQLPVNLKVNTVRQLGSYLATLFLDFQFATGGSLYLSPGSDAIEVGPIVSEVFYSMLGGITRKPLTFDTSTLRGPFDSWIQHTKHTFATIQRILRECPDDALDQLKSEQAQLDSLFQPMKDTLKLCEIYPGNALSTSGSVLRSPDFRMQFRDFRLSNIMVRPSIIPPSSICPMFNAHCRSILSLVLSLALST